MGTTSRLSFLLRSGRHRPGFLSARAIAWSALLCLAAASLGAGCGRTETWDYDGSSGPEPSACGDGACDPASESCSSCARDCGACPACGDGACAGSEDCGSCAEDCGPCPRCGDAACDPASESCSACPIDCGLCPSCGDGVCSGAETCSTCAADCGVCERCGDGVCSGTEDCLSCAPDCGVCDPCGNGVCNAGVESCFSCPADCGACASCGDGVCSGTETCASCQRDCGVCSVCSNGVCESFETCTACPQDCGACEPIDCEEVVTCAARCIDAEQTPPAFSIACVSACVSRGCANAQFFADQVLTCAFRSLPACNGDFGCIQKQCGVQLSACIRSTC
ncbi:hypothetical protein WME90_45770 [Sorangium sp. So ce375]|uniref:hypothetical protein n=1 Tax=Sorangium sp. So ce375 TaxID=3133306 RepID=UPI003F5B9065